MALFNEATPPCDLKWTKQMVTGAVWEMMIKHHFVAGSGAVLGGV
jgi:hypothetical protein